MLHVPKPSKEYFVRRSFDTDREINSVSGRTLIYIISECGIDC
jgi:hypothetical protein